MTSKGPVSEPSNRIKILLIEDRPSFLARTADGDARENHPPVLPEELGRWFDVRWLSTPGEVREFRDRSLELSRTDATRLGVHGWVPEVLVVDYALREDDEEFETRQVETILYKRRRAKELPSVSPIPGLRHAVDADNEHIEERNHLNNVVKDDKGEWKDVSGCIAGALVAVTFSDHPCAILAHTIHGPASTKGTHVELVEWMLLRETGGLFEAGTGKYESWLPLLSAAVPLLRQRIQALAISHQIDVDLEVLCDLAVDGLGEVVSFDSRFGLRRLPVAGLFLEIPQAIRATAVKTWANTLASHLLGSEGGMEPAQLGKDLRAARDAATRVWKAYCDVTRGGERQELSQLVKEVVDGGLDETEAPGETAAQKGRRDRLATLLAQWQVTPTLGNIRKTFAQARPKTAIGNSNKWAGLHEKDSGTTAAQRRWAALLLVVRFFHKYWERRKRNPAAEPPRVRPDDLWRLWFPASRTSLILPWHGGKSDSSATWKGEFAPVGLSPDVLLGTRGRGREVTGNVDSPQTGRSERLSAIERRVLTHEARALYGKRADGRWWFELDPGIQYVLTDGDMAPVMQAAEQECE